MSQKEISKNSLSLLDTPKIFSDTTRIKDQKMELLRRRVERELQWACCDSGIYADQINKQQKEKNKSIFAFSDRWSEGTCHPSQIVQERLLEELGKAKNEFLEFYRKEEVQEIKPEAERFAKQKTEQIFLQLQHEGVDFFSLKDVAVSANSEIKSADTHQIHSFLEGVRATTFANTGAHDDAFHDENISSVQKKNLQEQTEEDLGGFEHLVRRCRGEKIFDERRETVRHAKKMIFKGGTEKYYQWIDFDGAKRPQGIMLAVEAELIYEDILHGTGNTEDPLFGDNHEMFLAKAEGLKDTFDNIDASLHFLTLFLEEHPELSKNSLYAHKMTLLKEDRKKVLSDFRAELKTVISERKKQERKEMCLLSEKVHFMPRLDPAFIAVLKKREEGKEILSSEEEKQLSAVRHIIDQVIDLNISRLGAVVQIMIAQATGADDIFVLDRFLQERSAFRDQKNVSTDDPHQARNAVENISLCPLFESEKTTRPAFVQQVLEDLWKKYNPKNDNGEGKKRFETKISELFFAGSDLAKGMGQPASFLSVLDVAREIEIFNIFHDTDVRCKIGTGEAFFRQMGIIDRRAFTSLIRAKLSETDWEDKTEEEKAEIKKLQEFLRTNYGEDWEDTLIRDPDGLSFLLRKFGLLNSYTAQSLNRESTLSISPANFLRLCSSFDEQKKKTRTTVEKTRANARMEIATTNNKKKKRVIAERALDEVGFSIPESYRVYAAASQKKYQEIIGKEDKDLSKEFSSLPAFIQFLSANLGAMLRDRALARDGGEMNIAKIISDLTAPSIKARCIGANTVSAFLFPLGLLGQGSGILAAKEMGDDHLEALLGNIQVEGLLRLIREYSEIADDIFEIFEGSGNKAFSNMAASLREEWNLLQKIAPDLSEFLFHQRSTQEHPKFLEGDTLDSFIKEKCSSDDTYRLVSQNMRDLEKHFLTRADFFELAKNELGIRITTFSETEKESAERKGREVIFLSEDDRRVFLKTLHPDDRTLLDCLRDKEGKVQWNFESNDIRLYGSAVRTHGFPVLKKACAFLSLEKNLTDEIVRAYKKEKEALKKKNNTTDAKENAEQKEKWESVISEQREKMHTLLKHGVADSILICLHNGDLEKATSLFERYNIPEDIRKKVMRVSEDNSENDIRETHSDCREEVRSLLRATQITFPFDEADQEKWDFMLSISSFAKRILG